MGMASPITLDSKFVIVGSGIGGLSLALALAKEGARDVRLFERRSDIQELGAGLQIGPNASRLLGQLGLGESLEAVSERYPTGLMHEGVSGRKLADLPMDEHACRAYGAHSYQLLRADLLQLLRRSLKATLGSDPVHLGMEVVGLSSGGTSVCFSDGREEQGDLVIAADGVESRVRGLLMGDKPAASSYSGYFAWRGLLEADAINLARRIETLRVWVGEGRHLIAYPLKNGSLVNLVGVSEQESWPYERPVETLSPAEWVADYRDWDNEPMDLVGGLETCQKWSLRVMPSLKSWGEGRIGLLGDAAHPMVPSLAQGAAQAIEDAVYLAQLVSEGGRSGQELLQQYFLGRSARVRRVQEASLWNLKYFHRRKSLTSQAQNLGMRIGGRVTSKIIARRYHWLYRK